MTFAALVRICKRKTNFGWAKILVVGDTISVGIRYRAAVVALKADLCGAFIHLVGYTVFICVGFDLVLVRHSEMNADVEIDLSGVMHKGGKQTTRTEKEWTDAKGDAGIEFCQLIIIQWQLDTVQTVLPSWRQAVRIVIVQVQAALMIHTELDCGINGKPAGYPIIDVRLQGRG